jgi:diguanylate cyclase (GGDEF)-like protein
MHESDASTPERYLHSVDPRVSCWDIARIYDNTSDAVESLEAFLSEPAIFHSERDIAAAHLSLATAHAMRSDLDAAEAHIDEAERRFALLNDELSLAYVQIRKHFVQHQHDEHDAILAALPRAFRIASEHGDTYLTAALLNDRGLIELLRGMASDGVASYIEATRIAEEVGDHFLSSMIRLNIGGAFLEVHDFEVAIIWLIECLEFAKRANSVYLRFQCNSMLAQCFQQIGNAERALAFGSEAIRLAPGIEYLFSVAECVYDIAIVRSRLGRSKLAIEAFELAASLFHRVDTQASAARRWVCAWCIERETDAFTRRTYDALLAVAHQDVVTTYSMVFDLYDALAQSATVLGLKDDAISHLQRSKALAVDYWQQIGEKQARIAVSQYQLARAQSEAEREREHREELAEALDEAESFNRVNQGLVAQLRAQSAILEQQATEDALTGVGNRRYFDLHLEREAKHARAFMRPLSVALVDLDNFKSVNDRFTHQMGDRVLVAFAVILRENVAPTDFVARYGGEEFGIVLPETDQATALERAEAIRLAIAHHPWPTLDNGLHVTASIGIATAAGNGTAAELLTAADRMLHAAKEHGKNQVWHHVAGNEILNN